MMNKRSERRRWRAGLPPVPACWAWPLPREHFETVADLYYWHEGRCAVCGRVENIIPDHDHETMLIRGWLCARCNSAEVHHGGVFDQYRAINPASNLDIHVRYFRPRSAPGRDSLRLYRGA